MIESKEDCEVSFI